MKIIPLSSEMSHPDPSLFVFSDSAVFDKVSTFVLQLELRRTCSTGHKNVPNIVSLSHCLEQLYSCISVSYVKACHVFFVYFLSACVLMHT